MLCVVIVMTFHRILSPSHSQLFSAVLDLVLVLENQKTNMDESALLPDALFLTEKPKKHSPQASPPPPGCC